MLLDEGELAAVIRSWVPAKVLGQLSLPSLFSPYIWDELPVSHVKINA